MLNRLLNAILRRLKYDTLPLASIGKSYENRAVYLTFDDGYPSWSSNVFHILSEQGIPATFFVSSGFITGEAQMWWTQINPAHNSRIGILREIKFRKIRNQIATAGSVHHLKSLVENYGLSESNPQELLSISQMLEIDKNSLFDFALHSKHHLNLRNSSWMDLEDEIQSNIDDLKQMGIKFERHLAFPYGQLPKNDFIQELKVRHSIKFFFSTKPRAIKRQSIGAVIPRVTISGRMHTIKGHFVLLCILSRMN